MKRIGFRNVKLIQVCYHIILVSYIRETQFILMQDPVDDNGLTFYFQMSTSCEY